MTARTVDEDETLRVGEFLCPQPCRLLCIGHVRIF
jgi:hypothetical protein